MERTATDAAAEQKPDEGRERGDAKERGGGTTTEDLVREQGEDSSDEPES